MWPIAVKTLLADRGKLLTALVGIVFSVVLVNVQGGLFVGLIRKASLLVDNGQADIWVGHRQMHNVDITDDIPRRWVQRIRGIPGVKAADPYVVGWSTMSLADGGFEGVIVVGCEPARLLGNAWTMAEGEPSAILKTDGIIVDACDASKLGNPRVGDLREIGDRRARVVGLSRGIMGFVVAPYVFTTLDRATAYVNKSGDVCSYFLVQLEAGAESEAVCKQIRDRVPGLDAYPREVYSRMSVDYWMRRTGLGISFGASTLLGLLVGLVMVAETLYASVLDRLAEFGTLKAIGAEDRQIYRILLAQAMTMAAVGSVVGLLLVAGIQAAFSSPRSPITIPWWLSLGSCAMVVGICLAASVLPYLRVRKLDPLVVLQS